LGDDEEAMGTPLRSPDAQPASELRPSEVTRRVTSGLRGVWKSGERYGSIVVCCGLMDGWEVLKNAGCWLVFYKVCHVLGGRVEVGRI
jgi:hypothetical protein